jgi:hypothetical protein
MTGPWHYALTVGPLGFYLWVLAFWQSGRHPRVVNGLVDFALLAFGLGGVLAFGPFGQFLARSIFGQPDLLDWLVILSGLGLSASVFARKALHRVVVYHIDEPSLLAALDSVLSETGGHFARTIAGFEDREASRGLRVEFTGWLRCATVEAHGRDPESLIQDIRRRLRRKLATVPTRPSPIALGLYGTSILVMLVPLIGLFLTQPRARQALRVLLERLRGA